MNAILSEKDYQRYIIDSKNETAISVQAAIEMSKLIVISAKSFHDAKLQQMRQKQKKKTKVFVFLLCRVQQNFPRPGT